MRTMTAVWEAVTSSPRLSNLDEFDVWLVSTVRHGREEGWS
ncbi:hypothetical protein [Nocardia puris]|nr:hypothetical protein [Nocardia puris]